MIDGAFGDKLFARLDKIGIVGLGYPVVGYRHLQTKKPVKSFEDMKGLKIRVMEAPIYLSMFKAFGAQPTPMSFSEIYVALEQGVIDGIEVPSIAFYVMKFYEVAKFMTKTQHSITVNPLMFSKRTFNKLSPELQKIVRESGREATIYQRQCRDKEDKELDAKLIKAGVTIYDVNIEEFMKACKPVKEAFFKQYPEELTKYLR